ncbi:MAG: ABC transporter permease [Proteobacteria bacterium]|nr:ABC transporter permease [Pseudomonadota bacterium]
MVVLVISFIGFSVQYSIGDPVRDMVGIRVSAAEREALREKLGLNDPFWTQYLRFVKNASHGDLGTSYFYSKPALQIILKKAPATIELVLATVIIIAMLSLPIGMFSAIRPNHWFSKFAMGVSTVGVSVPVFLSAIGLIYLFGVELNWLPSYGRGDTVNIYGWETGFLTWDGIRHLILPSVALTSIMLPLYIRLLRAQMMEVLESEYIKYAWAKGLDRYRIWLVHALKNTLLPVITVVGAQIGVLFAFTILTETVFQWQGMGFMFYESVERSDTALLVAYLVFIGVMFVLINTIVDIIYGLINPTVRIVGTK